MVPTPRARTLLSSVQPALSQLHSALADLATFDPHHHQKTFTLGLRDVLEATFLPHLMTRLQPYPGLNIVSQRVPRRAMEKQLAAGQLDFAIDVLLPVSAQTRHQLLQQDRLVVLARPQHPLVNQGLTADAYLAARHVLVSSRSTGPGLEDHALARQGWQRQVQLRCQHYFAACQVVAQTDLLLTMPQSYARLLAPQHQLHMLAPPCTMPAIDVHLYWHRDYEQDPPLQWFRQLLPASA